MSLQIRSMSSADLAACAEITCNSPIGERYGFTTAELSKRLGAALDSSAELFVAEVSGRLAGFAWIDPHGAFSSAPYLRLIAVDSAVRGGGVGGALLREFEQRSDSVGRDFFLLVSDFNDRAIAFYERNGYRQVGRLPDFARPGITEVIMVKARATAETRSLESPPPSRPEEASFDRVTRVALAEKLFTCAHLRLERPGEPAYEKCWGDALCVGEERVTLRPGQLFDIASLSKLFTSTAVLRLCTLGRLTLETPLLDVSALNHPELHQALTDISIRSLLDHSSGIHPWYPFYAHPGEPFDTVLAQVLRRFPRRSGTVYSDINYMLLGLVVETVHGAPLSDAMQDLVFEPLQLSTAHYRPGRKSSHADRTNTMPITSHGYVGGEFGNRIEMEMVKTLGLSFDGWRDTGKPIIDGCDDGNAYYCFDGAAGHAGIFASAADIARLTRVYIDGSSEYLSPELVHTALQDNGAGRGLGFQLGALYPEAGLGHTGFTGSYVALYPTRRLLLVLLTNRLHVEQPRDINPYRQWMAGIAVGG